MHLLSGARPPEMAGVGCDGLSGSAPGEQAKKNTEVYALRDELFDAHRGDMYIRQMSAHIGVSFIGANNEFSRFGHGKIYTGERYSAGEEFFAQMQPGRMCQQLRIGTTLRRTKMFMKDLTDLFFFLMDTGQYDMAGRFFGQLNDAFAEIGV